MSEKTVSSGQLVVGSSVPNPDLLGIALAAVLRWAEENDIEPSEKEVARIIGQYEGMVESEPFPVLVVEEPLLVERRKQLVVS